MWACFGNREIEFEEQPRPHARPVKSYRFVRPSSTKSNSIPFDTAVYQSSSRVQPIKDTFQPPEGDDSKPRNASSIPLPPVIHQPFYHPQPNFQQPLQHAPADMFQPLPPPPPAFHPYPPAQQHNLGPGFRTPEPIGWPDNDNATIIVDDSPQYAVARHLRRDSRGRTFIVRDHRTGHHARSASCTRHARNNGGRYSLYCHADSDGNRPSREWDDGDSWSGRDSATVKSGYWSDGGDSWDEYANEMQTGRIGRRIESGRRDGRRGYYLT
jgi:hypothetical protein